MFLNTLFNSCPESADKRYVYQTRWTSSFRTFLLRKLPYEKPLKILEVGSGTGAFLDAFRKDAGSAEISCYGADIDHEALIFSNKRRNETVCMAFGEELPFPSNYFDLVCCHYLLLWVNDPAAVLREFRRVSIKGGICAAAAEPSYTEMIAEPYDLALLADQQRKVLAENGADLRIGSDLESCFLQAGFQNVVHSRYQDYDMDDDTVLTEIRQMQEDTGDHSFVSRAGIKYTYIVPTYYAYAVK